MPIDQDVDTQLDDLDLGVDQDTTDETSTDNNDGDFLVVNDRQKYKTKDDAIKGITEAGTRISQLSVWEKEAKALGITDPKQIRAMATEYSKLLAEAKKGKTAASEDTTDEPELTDEEKKARQWLMKTAKKVGLLSADDVKDLKEKIKTYESRFATEDQSKFDTLVDQGRVQVKSLMKEAKLPTDNAKLFRYIESGIADFVNEDDERIGRFKSGGESHREVVAEAFKDVVETLNMFRKQTSSNYTDKKQNAIVRNGKQMPQPGAVKSSNQAQRSAGVKKTKEIGITPAVHEAAWKLFNSKVRGDQSDE